MKYLTLTHNQTKNKVVVNWDNVLFAAETSTNLGDEYTEIAYENSVALPVRENAEEIMNALKNADE
jgi:hypothetical protein